MLFAPTRCLLANEAFKLKILETRGCARNFPTGADSSDEGAKIWFSWYYKCQKSPKNCVSPSNGEG